MKLSCSVIVCDRHNKKRPKNNVKKSFTENMLGRRKKKSAFLKGNDRSSSRNVRT